MTVTHLVPSTSLVATWLRGKWNGRVTDLSMNEYRSMKSLGKAAVGLESGDWAEQWDGSWEPGSLGVDLQVLVRIEMD